MKFGPLIEYPFLFFKKTFYEVKANWSAAFNIFR